MNYTFFIKVYSFSFRNNHMYISIAFLKFHGVCVQACACRGQSRIMGI